MKKSFAAFMVILLCGCAHKPAPPAPAALPAPQIGAADQFAFPAK